MGWSPCPSPCWPGLSTESHRDGDPPGSRGSLVRHALSSFLVRSPPAKLSWTQRASVAARHQCPGPGRRTGGSATPPQGGRFDAGKSDTNTEVCLVSIFHQRCVWRAYSNKTCLDLTCLWSLSLGAVPGLDPAERSAGRDMAASTF
ncbi:hypothetical protein BD289DRAFT_442877 [Coniella lustricola]|uniref:Uncharacterized protein n=1 Tax=Coniella lustricola TaxID=2025994 RepID=A0A2T2ZXR8_9PEZI|nr:hypothetical protein BD289DRAFT_442877 [Coniella lustricola]